MGRLMDYFFYDASMHFELLTTEDGVSLERLNKQKGLNTTNNWHSASSSVGYATPGHENSQHLNKISTSAIITVEPKLFSPNNDGNKDYTSIHYQLKSNGWVATVGIYTDYGRSIRTLVNNQSMANTGIIVWNGTDDSGQLMPMGIYIVLFRIWKIDHSPEIYKKTVVLLRN